MQTTKTWLFLGIAGVLCVPSFASAQGPTIVFTSPTEVDEGEAIPVEVTVTGAGTVSWSWDTDFDMSFGELAGASTYTVPASDTDGPATVRVGVRGTDDTGTRQVYRSITVSNLPPELTSFPPLSAQAGEEYRYEAAASDPAGTDDALEYSLTSMPDGMSITDNVITWTPSVAQQGLDFSVTLSVNDGDGGEDEQTWTVGVADNTTPTTPTPISPIMDAEVDSSERVTLTVANASDADGDPLLYNFRLSRTLSFDGTVIASGEIEEGSGSTTSWTTSEPLDTGDWYWQVWVSDGVAETAPVFASFVVAEPSEMPDAGGPLPETDAGIDEADAGGGVGADGGGGEGGDSDGGCSVSAAGAAPGALAWLLSLGLGLILVSRRHR